MNRAYENYIWRTWSAMYSPTITRPEIRPKQEINNSPRMRLQKQLLKKAASAFLFLNSGMKKTVKPIFVKQRLNQNCQGR